MREEWVLDYSDYLAAQRLFRRRSLGRRLYTFTLRWFFNVLVLGFLLWFIVPMYPNNYSWAGLSGVMPLVILAITFEAMHWYAPRRGYKRMFLNGDSSKPVYMEMDEEKITSGIPGSSEGKFFWSAITDFAEDQHIALLVISNRMFLMIPKNKLSGESWSAVKTVIARHVLGAS